MRDDSVYLRHILDAIGRIQEYVHNMQIADFMSNHMAQDAVIRQFEVIGEATKNLSDAFRSQHSELPWKDMAGMRDKLIHQYFGVDIVAVWSSVQQDLPAVKTSLTSILKQSK